jgi:hypothetical protein
VTNGKNLNVLDDNRLRKKRSCSGHKYLTGKAPNINLQAPEKLQATRAQALVFGCSLVIGAWTLGAFLWYLIEHFGL